VRAPSLQNTAPFRSLSVVEVPKGNFIFLLRFDSIALRSAGREKHKIGMVRPCKHSQPNFNICGTPAQTAKETSDYQNIIKLGINSAIYA